MKRAKKSKASLWTHFAKEFEKVMLCGLGLFDVAIASVDLWLLAQFLP
jgi:hypothetical protein